MPIAAPTDPPAARRPAYFRSLAEAIRDSDELITHLELPDNLREPARRAAGNFPLLVPRSFLNRIRPGDPADPLLRQVLPLGEEDADVPGFSHDAVGDSAARKGPGLIQKYQGRALLVASSTCAVHCRYCFRRHFPYTDDPAHSDDWGPTIASIRDDSSLSEIILSGGDPLMLTDSRLAELVRQLETIPHLKRLRIHTRLPIVLPDRVTEELLEILADTSMTPVVVIHANHPRELVDDCAEAIGRLSDGIGPRRFPIFNQAVLLRGVNDDVSTLAKLSERLVDLGVVPYYLHQLDRVTGAAHFEVPEEEGRRLVDQLAVRLPGYMVPRYVREIPGEPGKSAIV